MPNKKTKTHGSFAACTFPSYKKTYAIKGVVVWPKKQEANAINRHYYFVQLFYKKTVIENLQNRKF